MLGTDYNHEASGSICKVGMCATCGKNVIDTSCSFRGWMSQTKFVVYFSAYHIELQHKFISTQCSVVYATLNTNEQTNCNVNIPLCINQDSFECTHTTRLHCEQNHSYYRFTAAFENRFTWNSGQVESQVYFIILIDPNLFGVESHSLLGIDSWSPLNWFILNSFRINPSIKRIMCHH